jgi:hypothetical protein
MSERLKDSKMDAEALQAWILRQLGAPTWAVELTCEQVQDSIENARRWFCAKKGVHGFRTVQATSGETEYDLDEIDSDIDTVLNVAFAQPGIDLSIIFAPWTLLEEKVPYDVFAAGATAGLYSSYVQSLQYIDMAKRILSAELDWRQEGRSLYISPSPNEDRSLIIGAKMSVVHIEKLNERDHDLIKRRALAEAMKILARVRGKYPSMPGASGDFSMDASDLREEARDMFETLEEEIIGSGGPMGFMVG